MKIADFSKQKRSASIFVSLQRMVSSSESRNALSRERKEQDYTQEEVAEAVSISVRWYQKLESGKEFPSAITLIRLVLFLHIDVEEFREEAGLVVPVRSIHRKPVLR